MVGSSQIGPSASFALLARVMAFLPKEERSPAMGGVASSPSRLLLGAALPSHFRPTTSQASPRTVEVSSVAHCAGHPYVAVVTPAKAGVQDSEIFLDSGFCRNDGSKHGNRSEEQERRQRWPMS